MLGRRSLVVGGDAEAVILRIIQGSDCRISARWRDSEMTPVPIASVTGAVKDDEGNTLVADLGIFATLEENDTLINIAILATATSAMPDVEHGTWDLTATSTSGEIKTLMQGPVVSKPRS